MAYIGTFTTSKHGYSGQLHTLTLNLEVHLVRQSGTPASDNAPEFHLQTADGTEIGAAWRRVSKPAEAPASAARGPRATTRTASTQGGRPYLSVLLDDPSFAAPIYARLIEGEDGQHKLYWTRSQAS